MLIAKTPQTSGIDKQQQIDKQQKTHRHPNLSHCAFLSSLGE